MYSIGKKSSYKRSGVNEMYILHYAPIIFKEKEGELRQFRGLDKFLHTAIVIISPNSSVLCVR
jgi:hypothetical protein